MAYIDREKFLKKSAECFGHFGVLVKAIEEIADECAADVVEVKHGEWFRTDAYPHRVYCSLCFKTYVTNEEAIQGRSWQHSVYCTEAEYCPHCGARMDGTPQKEG